MIFAKKVCGIDFFSTFVFLNKCESSSVGRARPCQGRGREFEPRLSLQNPLSIRGIFFRYQTNRLFVNAQVVVPIAIGMVATQNAQVVELVDTQDLKSCIHCECIGSSPIPGTSKRKPFRDERLFYCR
jgi:hypothetical protein